VRPDAPPPVSLIAAVVAFPSLRRPWLLTPAFAVVPLLLQGCATMPRREAVPAVLQAKANVAGFPSGIRYFPRDAGHVEEFERDFLAALEREKEYLRRQGQTGPLPPAAFLAISGGGDNGAFGAGLLNGWTKAGTRPQFKLVTGVSTGALIAPFAFLGPAYDERLKSLYTGISMHDIAEQRSVLSVLYGDAMADNTPLWNLVKKFVNQEMLDAIAVEREKGRILLVATTNLDARRQVIWNVTDIAASKLPGALALVQKILIASAAIPGTFPPVMIDVEAAGKAYQEMHVDGGTATQVFVYPSAIRLEELAQRDRTLYIIRNARLDPEWAQVDRRTLPIAFRAITCLIQYQGMGDLYRIYAIAQRDRVDYNLAFIPATFDTPHTTEFDTTYMRALFELGYRMAAEGHRWWYKHPPVLVSGVDEEPEAY
jgi:predicted acylesterase/phospholipase RssA